MVKINKEVKATVEMLAEAKDVQMCLKYWSMFLKAKLVVRRSLRVKDFHQIKCR